jgi:hypothetical protein
MIFVPNGLTEYNNPFLFDVSVFQSSRGCGSPAAPPAPSLRLFVPSGPLMRRGCIRVPIHFYSFFLSGRRFNVPVPTLFAVPSCFWVVAGPSKMRSH